MKCEEPFLMPMSMKGDRLVDTTVVVALFQLLTCSGAYIRVPVPVTCGSRSTSAIASLGMEKALVLPASPLEPKESKTSGALTDVSTTPAMLARVVAPKVLTHATNATPSAKANDVAAVRLEFRALLLVAS